MEEQVERLVAMTHQLTPERVKAIAEAYRRAGFPHGTHSVTVARLEGRMSQVTEAMRGMSFGVQMWGMLNAADPHDIADAVQAAKNAGVALATEDLIGRLAYSTREYGRLVDPWFAGFADLPITEKGNEDEQDKSNMP